MLCQQLFTSRPIIFIGFSSLASVDRLIYSNSESHLYSLYQKAQPALHLNATLSGAGMWRASKCCLIASIRHSGTCTKECCFGEILFASIYNWSRNGCNYILPGLLGRTYGKISLKNVTLGYGLPIGIMQQLFFFFF